MTAINWRDTGGLTVQNKVILLRANSFGMVEDHIITEASLFRARDT
jgi:hypothetical protein